MAEQEKTDYTPWLEPEVQTLAIFTELFRVGDKSEADMEIIMRRYSTTMAWVDFWAKEGYLSEVIKGSERLYGVSGQAALALELP